jgi:hypothetical protein
MFVKIIGKNHGSYPYRVGLNTLKYTNETFNPAPECGHGGLYYCEIQHVFEWLSYGDTVCIVRPADDATVVQIGKKWKTDQLIIDEMKDLWEVSTIKWLVEHGAVKHMSFLLRCVVWKGRLEIVKYIVEKGDKTLHAEALRTAVSCGQLTILKYLLENGSKKTLHKNAQYAMRWAIQNEHLDVIQYLCEQGALTNSVWLL